MDKKINYYSNEDFTFTVKAETPLKAAKKIWKHFKYDSNFIIFEKNTKSSFKFNPDDWSKNGKFIS